MAYLTSKGFSEDRVAEIVRGAPNWLEFSVEDVDARLGFFQVWIHRIWTYFIIFIISLRSCQFYNLLQVATIKLGALALKWSK